MRHLDLLVVAALAVMAAWPLLAQAALHAWAAVQPRPASRPDGTAAGSSNDDWRQAWALNLIELIEEIEQGKTDIKKPEAALRLARELLWQVIGGEGAPPSSRP